MRRAVLYPQPISALSPRLDCGMFVQSARPFYITDEPLVGSSKLDQDHAAHDSLSRRAGVSANAGLSRFYRQQKGEAAHRFLPHAGHHRPEPRRLRTNLF